ncbi:hypothetical protein ZIOFF_011058 [Zingiber officinale]|uniref:Uncharacterized protein n=1 Tax=Zingiber officinale TaxID=94328 RepID=A0A8J5HJN6_ZINOF|nr:hypothetical protein ZIOFF_011058 [Zingiber officinale]
MTETGLDSGRDKARRRRWGAVSEMRLALNSDFTEEREAVEDKQGATAVEMRHIDGDEAQQQRRSKVCGFVLCYFKYE